MTEEQVQVYDEYGAPVDVAPRSRVRAENLIHAATGVLVRDPMGRVLVHRRTDTKDVYPGRWDFAAGGVMAAGESPDAAARRELAEEVGVAGVPLTPLGRGFFGDDRTRYWGHSYLAEWDGPVRGQPEEVAELAWWPLETLAARLDDPAWSWIPDTVALLGPWVRERAADRAPVSEPGWDSAAEVAEGRWVDRRPLRAEIEAPLLAETRLLPRLAPLLPLAVPVPQVMAAEPLWVRHALVPGDARPDDLTARDGEAMGALLRTLHDLPETVYGDTGVPSADAARAELLEQLDGMRRQVLPLLDPDLRSAGARLLDAAAEETPTTLVHHDLGPDHLLVTGEGLSGIIDWTDARVADPAIDLSWTVHGAPREFAEAVASSYSLTGEERDRGLRRHRLGPWWEVRHGQLGGGASYVDSGLAGIRARLLG
ncbi:phosphotransferase [Nocardioides rotundus]|uniref:phosphotransferase n=1 Tax=Nocardioides rotundus TaxID=1774216 RepID=UPI001CC1641A|nr:phosphotransferase [Nocardioides rotundus]UAL29729.1 phosphotransferase [Nocardioides rotundus]